MSKERNATQKKETAKRITAAKAAGERSQKAKLTRIGLIIAVVLAVVIFIKFRPYIGYYVALLAIPYGAYGLFVPYKKRQTMRYSRLRHDLLPSTGNADCFAGRIRLFLQHPVSQYAGEPSFPRRIITVYGAVLLLPVGHQQALHQKPDNEE